MVAETDYINPRRARRSARDMLLYRTLSGGGNALAIFLLLRLLSEEQYGVYSLFMSVLPILAAVLSMGLASTVQRFMPELVRRREFTLVKRAVFTMVALRTISLLVVAVVASLWADELLAAYSLSSWSMLVLPFAVIIFSDFQARLLRSTLVAFLEMRLATSSQVVFSLIKVAGYAIGLWQGWSLAVIIWIDVLANVALMLLLAHAGLGRLRHLHGPSPQFETVERQRLVRYALYYSFNDASGIPMGKSADQLFIGYYLEPVMVAAYAFATTLNKLLLRITPVRYFIEILRTVFFASGNTVPHEVVGERFLLLSKLVWILMLPVYFVLFALYEPMTGWLLAGKYQQFGWVVFTMLGFGLIAAIEMPVLLVLQLRERSDLMFYGNFFALYNLLMDWWLIPLIGLWGALLATGSAVCLRLLFWWWFVRLDAPVHRLSYFLCVTAVYWVMCSGALMALNVWLPSDQWRVITGLALSVLAGLVYLRLPLFAVQERALALESLGKRWSVWANRLGWFRVRGAGA
ncbi:MAG TPA: polysaccharide biosynthesis C-terminal domain-containing protein [Pseudomonadales bacterium]